MSPQFRSVLHRKGVGMFRVVLRMDETLVPKTYQHRQRERQKTEDDGKRINRIVGSGMLCGRGKCQILVLVTYWNLVVCKPEMDFVYAIRVGEALFLCVRKHTPKT